MHIGLILVAVPLVFELLFVGQLSQLLSQVEVERQKESEAREVQTRVNKVLKLLITIGGKMGAYAFTRGGEYLVQYNASRDELLEQLRRLEEITVNKPEAHVALQKIHKTVMESVGELKHIRHMVNHNEGPEAIRNLRDMRDMVKLVSTDADGILNLSENVEKVQAENQAKDRARIESLMSYFIALNILVAVALAIYFTKATTNRLKVLMENTSRLTSGEPLKPPVSGGDEIAELDQVFRNMATALAESEAHKQELIAIVSHDLRSPLTSVQGVLTLLSTGVYGELNDYGQSKLEVADRSIATLIKLINDLLDIEKMKAGKQELHIEAIRISEVVNASVDSMRGLAEQRKIEIDIKDSDALVLADRDRLHQVVANILSNSIKFSPDGSIITISILEIKDSVEVRIQDRGPGIPEKYRATIFESFEQVEDPEAKRKGGTGLGLAICKAIIGQHGGTLGVESEEGQGSTFWFRVPKG
jgi:signal transduction histidine kinase